MAGRALLFTALLLVIGIRESLADCSNSTYFTTQLDLLLAEYDRAELPPGPVLVRATLDVQHASIDDKSATVRLLAAMHLAWEDSRLSWNASSWGCDSAVTSSELVWRPDVSALTAVVAGDSAGQGLRARLASDGRVSWVVRFDITSPVGLALRAWPRDVQEAVFKFGSRFRGREYKLTIDDFKHATIFESSTWELLKVESAESTWMGGDVAQWTVSMRRRAAAHSLAAAAVLAAAALLLLAAALLPPAARPALCAAASFTAALWLIAAPTRLPGAAGAPQSVALMGAVCVAGALAAAGAALVLRVAALASPPPSALRSLLTVASAYCKLSPPDGSEAEWSVWAAAAQLLDTVLLTVLVLALLVIVCIYAAIP